MTVISGAGVPGMSVWGTYSGGPLRPGSESGAEPEGKIASQAVKPRVTEADKEADKKAAEAEMQRKSALAYIALYIETYGAPEEKEQQRVPEEPNPEDETEEERARRRKDADNIINTIGETVQDPDDPDKVHVLVKKIDAEGKAKYTRNVTVDNGGSGGGDPVGEPIDGASRSAVLGGKDAGKDKAGIHAAGHAEKKGTGILSSDDDDESAPVV